MLYVLPLVFALIGLAFYGVLGGADFGAGFWQLTAGTGEHAAEIREQAHQSMAPVWEANHVWLIFVLTVIWTAYPRAFGSLASTLSVALLIAAVGIICRGAAYALRSGSTSDREQRAIDTFFGVASLIAPFALGAAAGGLASGRVPVGNAAGHLFSSWLNPTSILIGALAVVTGAYLSAVFLCGDAARAHKHSLADRFRTRALGAALVAGPIAIAGLVVLHGDAHPIYHQLVAGRALPALIASVLAGLTTLGFVYTRRYEPARYSSAVAVGAIVAGWALAQSPRFLPGLTVRQAAASHDTQVAVLVAILAGAAILFPSLLTLFRLALRGRFEGQEVPGPPGDQRAVHPDRRALLARTALALLVAGFGLTNVADALWAHLIGAACFIACIVTAFRVALPVGD